MTTVLETAPRSRYAAVPLEGLAGTRSLDFQVFLMTARDTWVLYRDIGSFVDAEQLGRLRAEGITNLYIRNSERWSYFRRVEGDLPDILSDRTVPVEQRAEILHGVAADVAKELMRKPPGKDDVQRAHRVLHATSGLLLRDPNSFRAVRQVLSASAGLAQHSLTVSFLSMGLARYVIGADPSHLVHSGMAGLLHDVGRVGHEHLERDDDHTCRGADLLTRLGQPEEVVQAALYHHERFDGSGFPAGLRGEAIPITARVVMLADTFEKVYTSQRPQVGVFDALRIMAHAWRGCFDPQMVGAFVKLFG